MFISRLIGLAGVAAFLAFPCAAGAQTSPLLFVGDRDYPPLSYLENGIAKGFDVDVATAVARVLGREIKIELMEWDAAQQKVLRGEADGLTDLAISAERQRLYAFAEPTVTHDFGVFVRLGGIAIRDAGDLSGKRVGVTAGGFPRQFFEGRSGVTVATIGNYEEGFERLASGALDAIAADTWVGAYTIEQRRLRGISLAGSPFASVTATIAVRKDNRLLAEEIDRAVRAIRSDGTLAQIQGRWNPKEIVFLSRERLQILIASWVGGALGVLLIGTVVWALTLKRQMRVRQTIESQLVESGRYLGLALSAATMGTWRWSAATNRDTRDANLNRILGLEPVESTQDVEDFFKRVHPDDRAATVGEFERALREGDGYLSQFRIVRPDGTVRLLRGRGRAFYAASGQPMDATGVAIDVTEEAETEKRAMLLAHAFKTAGDCIAITDPERRILYVNDAFLRTYEYEERELLGQAIDVIYAGSSKAPDDTLSLSGASAVWRGEVSSRSKSGLVVPMSISSSLVRNQQGDILARVDVARDITNEKRSEDALRASEEKFFKVFDANPNGMTVGGIDGGGILNLNQSFERITGYTRSELVGHTLDEIGAIVGPSRRHLLVETLQREGTANMEFRIRRKSGEIATLEASAVKVVIGGHPCFVTATRDVTEQKRFEVHLRQAAEVNKLLLSELDLKGLCTAVIEAAHQILDLDYAGLVLVDPDTRMLHLQGQRGVADAGRWLSAAPALASGAVERGQLELLRGGDLERLGEPVAPLRSAGVQAVCSLPLTTVRETLGALIVGSRNLEAFSGDDVTLLQQLATHVAIAIQNARAYQEIRALKDQLSREKLYLEEEIRVDHNFADIVGDSPAIKRVLQQIETVAPTDASVLLLGETGTGKELLARAIHELSPRKDRTFVRLNVAALPASLLESELFGYERGAFTGAQANKVGRMELAHRGTLFLDEVGDIPLEIQPKLLRVLQEREFERLGSTRTQHVDIRLIAATNRDLRRMVAEGTFRSDLFYRLNVFPLSVPPLRDRKEDIPLLVRYFVQRFALRFKRQLTTVSAATMREFQEWHWPGNIRELENVVERAVILSTSGVLQVPAFQEKSSDRTPTPSKRPFVSTTFSDGERELILQALRDANGTLAGPGGAAARLGMKRTTLQSKMRRLGIRRPAF